MSQIGKPERATQDRVIRLFQKDLGYRFLGDWSDRPGNSNIDEKLLTGRSGFVWYDTVPASFRRRWLRWLLA